MKTKEGKQKRKKNWSALTPDEIALFPENTTLEEIHENELYLKRLRVHRNKMCKRRKTEEKRQKQADEKMRSEQNELALLKALEDARKNATECEKSFYLESTKSLLSDTEVSDTDTCMESTSTQKKSLNRVCFAVPETSWHHKFFPRFYPSLTNMSEQDFKPITFYKNSQPNWSRFAELNSLAEQDLVHYQLTFDGLLKISRVFKANVLFKMWSKGRKLDSKRSHRWGYAAHPKEAGSKRTYAMSQNSLANLRESHMQFMLEDLNFEASKLPDDQKTALEGAFKFLSTKLTEYGDNTWDMARDFERWAANIAEVFDIQLDPLFNCLQWNFQHNIFAPHVDDCRALQEGLVGGDGFGREIVVIHLFGPDSTFYIAGRIPGSFPEKYIGLQFSFNVGDGIMLSCNSRYNCVHGIVAAEYPSTKHNQNCTNCKTTLTLRNGIGQPKKHDKSIFG